MPSAADTFLWDQDLKGFGLKITPSGSKSYIVQYRLAGRGSKTQRWSIGRHGTWTPATAREEAERLLRLVGSGVDPKAQSKALEAAAAQVAADTERLDFATYSERFLVQYGERLWRPRTFSSARSNMRRWIAPKLRGKQITDISRRDLSAVMEGLPASSPALPRNIFALTRKLFAWAVQQGDIERSPFDQMKSPPAIKSRTRVLTDIEMRGILLAAAGIGPPFGSLVLLLAVTGQRRTEVAGLRWEELSRGNREWVLPGSRSKNGEEHRIPLNELAIIELDHLVGSERWPRRGLILTTTGSTPISGYSRAKLRLDKTYESLMGEPIAPWRLHDLRRTFATSMQKLGVRFEVTEALLNHKGVARTGVAAVYQLHEWEPEKIEATDGWADKLRDLITTPPRVVIGSRHPLAEL